MLDQWKDARILEVDLLSVIFILFVASNSLIMLCVKEV